MSFSQRYGLEPIRKTLQVDSMDDDLKNNLWNCLDLFILTPFKEKYTTYVSYPPCTLLNNKGRQFLHRLCIYYFKKRIDTSSHEFHGFRQMISDHFNNAPWNKVYDFIQSIVELYPDEQSGYNFMKCCNMILEQEFSAYRFVDKQIVRITSNEEISAIEEAANMPDPFGGPRDEIKEALRKLSIKKKPDYRGSVKNSISAVEGTIKIITGQSNAKFPDALKKIEEKRKNSLHPALKAAFIKLYGYTSNSKSGIRHALLDKSNIDFAEAKFMLVACSAFINYLIHETKT